MSGIPEDIDATISLGQLGDGSLSLTGNAHGNRRRG